MQRREVLRLLLGSATVPLLPREALGLLQQVHDHLPAAPALKTLTPHQDAVASAIAEWIIPQTDTPGAKAARVNEFIDLILTEWYDSDDKARFLAGLEGVDQQSRGLCGKEFLECSTLQQEQLLTSFDEHLMQLRQAEVQMSRRRRKLTTPTDKTFFHAMKQLTLVGYFTSEVGARQALHYEIIPSRHDACAPLEEEEATK
jgi:hypothetical protein